MLRFELYTLVVRYLRISAAVRPGPTSPRATAADAADLMGWRTAGLLSIDRREQPHRHGPSLARSTLGQGIVQANSNGGAGKTITFDKTVFKTPQDDHPERHPAEPERHDRGTETIYGSRRAGVTVTTAGGEQPGQCVPGRPPNVTASPSRA